MIIGFGENSNSGLSSMDMMNFGTNRKFLPLPLSNNSGAQSSSNRRVSVFNITQDHKYSQDDTNSCSVRAKIMAHPLFPRLLSAYLNCQKVGAPPEVLVRLEEACAKCESSNVAGKTGTVSIGEDPALDQFMEAYCEMLVKFEQELTKPFKEAMLFFSRIDCHLKALSASTKFGDYPLIIICSYTSLTERERELSNECSLDLLWERKAERINLHDSNGWLFYMGELRN